MHAHLLTVLAISLPLSYFNITRN